MNDTEAEYSQKIQDILKSQFRKFSRLTKMLKYKSPGEYLRIFYEDENRYLEDNHFYLKSSFELRKMRFRGGLYTWPIIGVIPHMFQISYFNTSENLFSRLSEELLKLEFRDLNNSYIDLRIKINRYERLNNYLLMQGRSIQAEINYMILLLQERELLEEKKWNENLKVISTDPPFYYLLNDRKLKRLENFLIKENLIAEGGDFNSLFHQATIRTNFKSKLIWQGDVLALLFLFKSLTVFSIIKDSQISSKLSNSFLDKNGEILKVDSFYSMRNQYKMAEITTKGIAKWVIDTGNPDIQKVYSGLKKIYFNDLDLL